MHDADVACPLCKKIYKKKKEEKKSCTRTLLSLKQDVELCSKEIGRNNQFRNYKLNKALIVVAHFQYKRK